MLAWAKWHYVKNDNYQALKDAEEALYIADRLEYRLKQAEIHNFMAQIALDSLDTDTANRHAVIALPTNVPGAMDLPIVTSPLWMKQRRCFGSLERSHPKPTDVIVDKIWNLSH